MPTMFITKYIQSVQFCILSLVKVSSSEVSSSKISSAIVGGGQTSIGADNGSIVHKGSGGGHYTGVTGKDGGVSISTTLLPISLGSLNSSEVGSTGLSNLRGVLNRGRCDTIKYRGNQGLRVEGGCNSIIDRGNRQSGVSDTESSGISNIVNMLQLALSINIGVSSGLSHTSRDRDPTESTPRPATHTLPEMAHATAARPEMTRMSAPPCQDTLGFLLVMRTPLWMPLLTLDQSPLLPTPHHGLHMVEVSSTPHLATLTV